MILILDYGMGNPGSVKNMCARLGIAASIGRAPDEIMRAEKMILPGVGHYSKCVRNIDAMGLRPLLAEKVLKQRSPILGICMGMQVMTEGSEEGEGIGLGWIKGRTRRFRFAADTPDRTPKIPNMGWSYVTPEKAHPLLADLPPEPRFYFIHSYWVECAEPADALLRGRYGGQTFAAAFAKQNIAGVQFHIEKSHVFGMRMLANFANWSYTP